MAPQGIPAEKLTPHVGAVVHGADLSKPLDEGTLEEVHHNDPVAADMLIRQRRTLNPGLRLRRASPAAWLAR